MTNYYYCGDCHNFFKEDIIDYYDYHCPIVGCSFDDLIKVNEELMDVIKRLNSNGYTVCGMWVDHYDGVVSITFNGNYDFDVIPKDFEQWYHQFTDTTTFHHKDLEAEWTQDEFDVIYNDFMAWVNSLCRNEIQN